MKTKPTIAVFTLTWNRLEYTKRTFESMYDKAGCLFDHFVIDNASEDGTAAWLRTWPYDFTGLVFNRRNRGIPGASNQLRKLLVDYDYVLKVDNDCDFQTDNWLETMVDVFSSFPEKIVLGPSVIGVNKNVLIQDVSAKFKSYVVQHTRNLGGMCLMMDHDVFQHAYLGEYSHPLHAQDDGRYCTYALQHGYRLLHVLDVVVKHMDTSDGQVDKYPEYDRQRTYNRTSILSKP